MKIPEAERVLVFNQTSLSIDAAMNGQGYYLAYERQEKPMHTSVVAVLEWLRGSLIKSIEA